MHQFVITHIKCLAVRHGIFNTEIHEHDFMKKISRNMLKR